MNDNPDKQSELQKMLALKRHETPPPRYFSGFADKVINRLDSSDSVVPQTWWQRLGLDSKPVLVCVSGIIVCGCLAAGLVASLRVDPPKPASRSKPGQTDVVAAPSQNDLTAQSPSSSLVTEKQEVLPIGDPVVISAPSPLQPTRATLAPPPGVK